MSSNKLLIGALVLSLIISANLALAADTGQDPSAAPQPPAPGETPRMVGASGALRHGNTVSVQLKGLADYLKKHNELSKFVLYVDGIRVIEGARLIGDDQLRFDFAPGKVPKETWGKLSNCIYSKDSFYIPEFQLAVGYGKEPLILGEKTYRLTYIEEGRFWLFAGLYAALLAVLISLAVKTSIIRDPCPDLAVAQRPFSLGKAQMAFWFIIVLPCFFFIWLITGSTESLTGSTLILLSISTMTTLISGYVDKSKDDKENAEQTAQENKLREAGEQLKVVPPEAQAKLRAEMEEANDRLSQIKSQAPPAASQKSQGFIKDILRDSYGVNLHRFQCAVWTGVLGAIFFSTTFCSLAMPDFSGTLLTLLGISNGTYVALKWPEK